MDTPKAALVYNSQSFDHDTGYFTTSNDTLIHHLHDFQFVDEVYKPTEINYPYPFPETYLHPENLSRLEAILKNMEIWGLLEKFQVLEANPASEAEVTSTHHSEYIYKLSEFCRNFPAGFVGEATPIAEKSFEAAMVSAGTALTAGKLVLSGTAKRAYALTRPPGHHAGIRQAAGFCLLNNVAILTNYVLTQPDIERVLIIDWDVHHGNGTQEIFWENKQVLFNSFHQYGPGIYPGGGDVTEIGSGEGRGYTVNVPLPTACPDQIYLPVFEKVTAELAAQYQPDIIIVSAGQDGHFNDLRHPYLWEENSGFDLTAQCYYHLTRHVINLAEKYCQGRCVLVQEGGYDLTNLSNSVLNISAALLDLPVLINENPVHIPAPFLDTQRLQTQIDNILATLHSYLNEFWDFH